MQSFRDSTATWLGSPNFTPDRHDHGECGFPEQNHDMAIAPAYVVLHTMVGQTDAANARFQDASSQASAHYGVKLDGTLVQWVDEKDAAWHAGDYCVNLDSIGIEHEDTSSGGTYAGGYTDAQYQASAQLVAEICTRYGIPLARGDKATQKSGIVAHKDVSLAPTACPDELDVDRVIAAAAAIVNPGPAPSPSPAPDPPPAPAPTPAGGWYPDQVHFATDAQRWSGRVFVQGGANVRSGPSTDYAVGYQVQAGTVLLFDAWVDLGVAPAPAVDPNDARWFHVSPDSDARQGWIASALVDGNPNY